MADESVIISEIERGKLIYLRTIPRGAKSALKFIKEATSKSGLEKLLEKMRLPINFMKKVVKGCRKVMDGTIVSVVLDSIPLAIAIFQDKGIGRNVLMKIGKVIGSYIGSSIGTLIVDALESTLVPLMIEVGGIIAEVAQTAIVGTIVGAAFGGIGAIIGGIVATLIGVGVLKVISYIKKKFCQHHPIHWVPYKCELDENHFLKSQVDHLPIQWENVEDRLPEKRELEQLHTTKQMPECFPTKRELEAIPTKKELEEFHERRLKLPTQQEPETKQQLEELPTKREIEWLPLKCGIEQQFEKPVF